jgi:hypothetical protein
LCASISFSFLSRNILNSIVCSQFVLFICQYEGDDVDVDVD